MAFGLGFVLGPLLGGVLLALPVPPEWRLRVPFLVAAGFSVVALGLALTRLPESLPADAKSRQAARVLSWRGLTDTVALPGVGGLVLIGASWCSGSRRWKGRSPCSSARGWAGAPRARRSASRTSGW